MNRSQAHRPTSSPQLAMCSSIRSCAPQGAPRLLLQVHDDWCLEAPPRLDTVLATVKTVMKRRFASAFPGGGHRLGANWMRQVN